MKLDSLIYLTFLPDHMCFQPVYLVCWINSNGTYSYPYAKRSDFLGDISAHYKSGRTIVDVKVDKYSNVSTKVTVHDVMPCTKAVLSFNVPGHKSGKLDV